MSDALPRTLGRYELVEKLAVGGMAELYKARVVGAHGFEKPLVIKRIRPHLAADDQFVEMFIDEAKITASLNHPKIVQVHELSSDDDELFIVMEFIDGLDLLTLFRQCKADDQQLPPELAVYIIQEVLDALDYAHSARAPGGDELGIVHRDISPGNVLVSNRGDVKLADFGIARAAQRRHHTQTGTLKGKYGYMSPEQIMGDPMDGRSDLFSVAIVLTELLTFRRLFTAPNDLDVLLMVRDVRLDRLDKHGGHIDLTLRAVIEKALQRVPDDRYATAGEFRDALGDWLFTTALRPGRAHLEEFVANLTRTESEKLRAAMINEAVVETNHQHIATLSGPTTRAKKLEAEEAARVGRALFASGKHPALDADPPNEAAAEDTGVTSIADDDIPIIFDEGAAEPPRAPAAPAMAELDEPHEAPDVIGDFRKRSPFRVLHQLSAHSLDGLLIVEREGTFKEAYFDAGDPQFVRSNIASERLGEYLVSTKVISRDDLTNALAVLPHFGGRLGDTLVGLGLMRPLDAFRHLTQQVRDKLVDVCSWATGRYRWYADKSNPWPSLPLHLDTREIMGAGAMQLPHALMSDWATLVADSYPSATASSTTDLDAYGLGPRVAYVYQLLDGTASVRTLLARFSAQDRIDFLRVLYLLSETDACRITKSS
jgi:serine/threonine-protein kinase